MKFESVVSLFPDLHSVELTTWIEHRWVRPQPDEKGGWLFHDIDVARVRLVYDLRHNFDVPEETLPLLLSLLDQLYDLRRKLNAVDEAIADHPPELRDPLLSIIRDGKAEQ